MSETQQVDPKVGLLKSRAYHEAGHAIACLVCGLPIVIVYASVEGQSLCSHYVGTDRYTRYQEMLVSMCGKTAETAFGLPPSPSDPLSDRHDVDSIQNVLIKCLTEAQGHPVLQEPSPPGWIDQRLVALRDEASTLIEMNKQAVEQLAVHLQANGQISGDEIYQMLSALQTDHENQFANYWPPPRWYWDIYNESRTDDELTDAARNSFIAIAEEYQNAQQNGTK